MLQRVVPILSLVLTILVLAGCNGADGPRLDTGRSGLPVVEARDAMELNYKIARAGEPIEVDGVAAEEAWYDAMVATGFVYPWHTGNHPTTRAMLLWDERNLYVVFRAADTDVQADIEKRMGKVWEDGRVMLYIDATPDDDRYYALEINPKGTLLSFDADLSKATAAEKFDSRRWNTEDIRIATRIDGTVNAPDNTDTGYTVEMAIPWSVLERVKPEDIKPGMALRIGLFRINETAGVPSDRWPHGLWATTWSETPNFHNTDSFVPATLLDASTGDRPLPVDQD